MTDKKMYPLLQLAVDSYIQASEIAMMMCAITDGAEIWPELDC